MPQSGLGLIDSHAHIQGKEYAGESAAVIQRAGEAGVEQIIVVGGAGDMSSNTAAVALAESCANLYATVGMHPHDAKDVGEEELRELKELAAPPKGDRRRRNRSGLLLQPFAARSSTQSFRTIHLLSGGNWTAFGRS